MFEQFKNSVINRYQSLGSEELAGYLDSQREFFSEYEIQVIDFEFNPDHEGELIINFLVTGEDSWKEKIKRNSDFYTTDWKFYLFNIDTAPSEMLTEALHFELGPFIDDLSYEEIHSFYDELFLVLSDVVKTDLVRSVIKKYNLADNFRIQLIDSRDDKDYFE